MKLPIWITDTDGAGVSGQTIAVTRSIDGSALAAGAGTTGEIGLGAYWYDAPLIELSGRLLAMRAVAGAHRPFLYTTKTPLEFDFSSNAAERHVPIYLVDDAGDPVTGVAPEGAELQVSIDGAAWVDAEGDFSPIGSGLYDYEPTDDEAAPGLLLVKVDHEDARPYVYAALIAGPDTPTPTPPEPIPVPIVYGDEEYVDHVQLAIDRLPEQFKPKGAGDA